MGVRLLSIWLAFFTAIYTLTSAASALIIDWVTVGNPGNACDPQPPGCFGAVADVYRISKYETTNAQYTQFLNAVAAADPEGLYSNSMAIRGIIVRSGSAGSFTYSTVTGQEDVPVVQVSFYDALRFANWLHNGQPTGAQGNATTEDGAYALLGGTPLNVPRNEGARIFLTSEDEWYKAAYYDVVSRTYFDYPADSDTPTICAPPGATPNSANCDGIAGGFTRVGSYTASASPNGTFDQGGNVWEWNEAIINGTARGLRGGGLSDPGPDYLAASKRDALHPARYISRLGFRVASVIPEPGTGLLLGLGLLGLASRRRNRGGRGHASDTGWRHPAKRPPPSSAHGPAASKEGLGLGALGLAGRLQEPARPVRGRGSARAGSGLDRPRSAPRARHGCRR